MAFMDEIDRSILALWATDARRSLRDIAAQIGISATTAHERARGLWQRGVVRGAYLEVDLNQLGRAVQALVFVRIRPPSRATIEGFRSWVSTLPEILGVFVTSGKHDFVLHVAVADNDQLYAFIIDRLTSRTEIAEVETSTIFEHLRNHTVAAT